MECRIELMAIALTITACATPARPPPPPPPPPTIVTAIPPDSPDHPQCLPTAAACIGKAEDAAEANVDQAIALATACLDCTHAPPSAYRLKAGLHVDKNDKKSAIDTLMIGVRRYPQNAGLWLALGRLELESKRPREGIAALAQAQSLRPEDENIEDELGHALKRYGTDDEKTEAKVRPLLLEATGRYELEDIAGAMRTLEAAMKVAAGAPRVEAQVRHRLGLLAMSQADLATAMTHLTAGLRLAPKPTAIRFDLLLAQTEVLLLQGKGAAAATSAREAVAIDPANPLAHTDLAVSLATTGDVDGALVSFERASEAGLAGRLSREQVLGIGALEALREDPRFKSWVEKTWPR